MIKNNIFNLKLGKKWVFKLVDWVTVMDNGCVKYLNFEFNDKPFHTKNDSKQRQFFFYVITIKVFYFTITYSIYNTYKPRQHH